MQKKVEIEGAELNIYFLNGEMLGLDLSATQLRAVLQILGVKFKQDGYSYFADNSIKKLMEMEGNPFDLVELQKK